jgi:negative regulator of flagellin synthesis FlgM
MRKDGTMITPVGSAAIARAIELRSKGTAKSAPAATVDQAAPEGAASATTTASEIASQGAPIDTGKIASIRAGIANGSYKIDPKAIADRMIALDLPEA